MSYKLLKTELSILDKNFPRNDGCFQIIIASREELVCRFVDTKGNKYNLQCSISVSYIYRELNELVSSFYILWFETHSPTTRWYYPSGFQNVMNRWWFS